MSHPPAGEYALVELSPDGVQQSVANVGSVWESVAPGRLFEYSFLDDRFAAMYETETRMGKIFGGFAALALVIAYLGLFGLTA